LHPILGDRKLRRDSSLRTVDEHHFSRDVDLEVPLLTLTTDVKELVQDYIYECQRVNKFYVQEKKNIDDEFLKFYYKFRLKTRGSKSLLHLEQELLEHGIEGVGYSTSWVRLFIEFYSKIAWLDGFAKINMIAIQRILMKFDNVVFDQKNSRIYQKLTEFIHSLEVSKEEGCRKERHQLRK